MLYPTDRSFPQRASPRRSAAAVLLVVALLGGCAAGGGVLDRGAALLGYQKPEATTGVDALPADRKVALRLHAGDRLNVDAAGRSLSVVVRIYRLKAVDAFLAAPLAAFRTPEAEKAAFGADVQDVREVVLVPGQHREAVERLARSTPYVAAVALFRAPAEGRWRFAFAADGAERTGVTLGVHGCALSVAAGEPVAATPESMRLAGATCPATAQERP